MPFYWAPFVLIGDTQPLDLPPAGVRALWPIFAIASLAVLTFTFTFTFTFLLVARRRSGSGRTSEG